MLFNVRWQIIIMQGMIFAVVSVSLYLFVTIVLAFYFNDPPISMRSLDPPALLQVCPGEEHPISLEITIGQPSIFIYYASTMDGAGKQNIVGTQQAWTDLLHPFPATFRTQLPWVVPVLPAGHYLRVFAARNVVGHQRTVFLKTSYEIGENCPH